MPALAADPITQSDAYQGFLAYQDGYIAAMEGDNVRAVEKIRAALPSDPQSGRYRYTLAGAYMNMGKYVEAIQTLEDALATDMNEVYRAYSYYRLGKIYEGMGNREKMFAAFRQVLELAIGDPEIEDYARRIVGEQK